MRTIATRLLPNPHCLSSHAVHRIRHRPAVHSSRWLRVCPRRTSVRPGAPSDRCGATTTTKDGRPPPRSPLPSPPRYNPEMRRPHSSSHTAATASLGRPAHAATVPALGQITPRPRPASDSRVAHDGGESRVGARSCASHARTPRSGSRWKFYWDARAGRIRRALRAAFSSNSCHRTGGGSKQSLAQGPPSLSNALSTRVFAARPRLRAAAAHSVVGTGSARPTARRARPPTRRRGDRGLPNPTCEHAAQWASPNQHRVNGVPVSGHI